MCSLATSHCKKEAAVKLFLVGLLGLVTCSSPSAWNKECEGGRYFIKTNVCFLIFRNWGQQVVEKNPFLVHSVSALLWRWFLWFTTVMVKYIIVVWNIVFVVIVKGIWILQFRYIIKEITHSKPNWRRRIFRWVQKLRWISDYFLECAVYEDEDFSPKEMSWMS